MPPIAATLPPFGTLVEAHVSALACFLRGMLGPDDVEDALQETLLAALRAYPRFDGANPRAWLLTIARRKAIDEGRASGRRPGRLDDPDAHPGASFEGPGEGIERAAIWESVGGLPDRQRAAVVLRFALDLPYREIGEAMDSTEEAARRSVHEALKKLRKSESIEVEVKG